MIHLRNLMPMLSFAAGLLIVASSLPPTYASEPYCGVYSLYTCAQALDHPIDFESLLENEYVVGWEGSSIESLAQAAADIGLEARPLQSLGHWDLRIASSPVILHVRSDVTRPNFDHWVAFLGEKDGKAILVDPSHGEQHVAYSDLLAIWDGAGLAVGRSKSGLFVWHWAGIAMRILFLFGLAALLSVLFNVLRLIPKTRIGRFTRPIGVATILLTLSLALDYVTGSQVLSNTHAARTTTNLYTQVEFEPISAAELRKQLQRTATRDAVVLVDARREQDFAYRPLPGALSIPVNCSASFEADAISSLQPETPLVVYCQSAGCTYSDVVAKRLNARGFTDIRIYREGVVGWYTSVQPAESTNPISADRDIR